MALYHFENYTIPHDMIRSIFCNGEFTAEQVYLVFNITCNQPISVHNEPAVSHDRDETTGSFWDVDRKLFVAAVAAIFIIGIILNLILLTTLYKRKQFFKPSWYYVFNLAITDVLVLLNMAVFTVASSLPQPVLPERLQMFLFPSLDIFVCSASMLSVAAIALHSLLKTLQIIKKRRQSLMTKWILLILWMYCFAIFGLSISRAFYETEKGYNMFVFWLAAAVSFIGAILVTAFSYVVVVAIYIRRQCCDINTLENSSVQSLIKDSRTHVSTKTKKHRSALKSFLMILAPLPFLLGWAFYLGVQMFEVIHNIYLNSPALNLAMFFVPWLIAAVNPLIYTLARKPLRQELSKTFKQLSSKTTKNDMSHKRLAQIV